MFNRKWSTRASVLVGVMMVAMLITSFGTASAQSTGHNHANIGLRARVNPNITVAVGQPMTYEVAAVNLGSDYATNIEIGVPLDLGNLALTNASFTDSSGFVTAVITDPSINLLVAHLADRLDPSQVVTGTFTFVPQPQVLGATFLGTTSNNAIAYAIGIFDDNENGGIAISNRVEYNVGTDTASDGTGDQVQQCETNPNKANPSGAVDVRCRNFAPGERLHFWLNYPGGVAGTSAIDYADGAGEYGIDGFTPADQGLDPGDYSLVFHGDESGVDFVLPFTVQ